MDTRKSIVMLTNTGTNKNVVGDAIRSGSYFGRSNGLHTLSVKLNNFVGRFKIQGTLSLTPTENDWFDIDLMSKYLTPGPYLEFPLVVGQPTGKDGDTGVLAFTFVGQFTYLRAVVERDYLGEIEPYKMMTLGSIDRVLVAF